MLVHGRLYDDIIRHPLDATSNTAEKGGVIMIATTIEQSKRLLELGLDPESADMTYLLFSDGKYSIKVEIGERQKGESFLPAWSLSALLEVMPNNDYWDICLWQYQGQRWQCVFDDVEFSNGETKAFVADAPITAAYEMVCWLLRNNLITNN